MIMADTGFWLALANRADRHHRAARQALANINRGLITTWPVVSETCHLLLHSLGGHAQLAYMDNLANYAFEVFELPIESTPRIQQLMHQHADLPMDLADASLVILAESLNTGDILSTDQRDLHAYRWKQRKPFNNLLELL